MGKLRIQSAQVTFGKIELDIHYLYFKGYPGSREEPPEEASVEVEKIIYQGIDVIDLISEVDDNFFTKLETKILEGLDND